MQKQVINFIKNAKKNIFLVLKKLKNIESAQLCSFNLLRLTTSKLKLKLKLNLSATANKYKPSNQKKNNISSQAEPLKQCDRKKFKYFKNTFRHARGI